MINRILIRIKVLQILYAFYQNGGSDLKVAENELHFSLQKSYELYHYFFLLIIDVTALQDRLLDNRKHKYMPTEQEMNPNTRFIDNRFVKQLADNKELKRFVIENKISWSNDADFVKSVLDLVLASEEYANYLQDPDDSYETDKKFWRTIFKKLFCENEMISEYLEDKSIYWNDDVEIIETFALKTIRRFELEEGADQPLLPMFKDQEDRMFGIQLLREAILRGSEYRERVSHHAKNWETERVANIDMIIMQLAIAEVMTFPTIPLNVTLNEYIDMAKYYSTPKSGIFINGILDSVIDELKNEKILFKA
ncbi:N utilization substance protein B [Bacteroidia bacterium]|nr:N utilization substance protein B [Bacteroidia bacterium]